MGQRLGQEPAVGLVRGGAELAEQPSALRVGGEPVLGRLQGVVEDLASRRDPHAEFSLGQVLIHRQPPARSAVAHRTDPAG